MMANRPRLLTATFPVSSPPVGHYCLEVWAHLAEKTLKEMPGSPKKNMKKAVSPAFSFFYTASSRMAIKKTKKRRPFVQDAYR